MGLPKIDDEWPPSSPDLNPLDYCIWGMLEPIVNAKQHRSLEEMKRTLIREWEKLPMTVVRDSIGVWRERLKRVVAAGGGRFESNLVRRVPEDHSCLWSNFSFVSRAVVE